MDIVDKTASIIIPFFFSLGIKRKCRKIPPLNYLYILRAFIIYIALCTPSLIAYHFSIGFVVLFLYLYCGSPHPDIFFPLRLITSARYPALCPGRSL